MAPSLNTLRKTRRGMKIGLPKIANSLCQNNLKNLVGTSFIIDKRSLYNKICSPSSKKKNHSAL
jgi:hypothetical protein